MKMVIIGGGAGGASVAARTRRLDEFAEIILFEKSPYISQATCGIPYSLGNVIKDRSRLIVVDPEDFDNILDVDVRTGTSIVEINPEKKTVYARDSVTNQVYTESWDKLVLATGGTPVIPEIPGMDLPQVFFMQNLQDLDEIKTWLQQNSCHNAVVIGAGLIGLEVADNLHNLGMKVNVVEAGMQVLDSLDFEIATLIHQHLAIHNINLVLGDSAIAIDKNQVQLQSGLFLDADLVIVSIGTNPSAKLAQEAGLASGHAGGIAVNRRLETSRDDIYALGDSVEVDDLVTGQKTLVQLAGPVHKQAAVVAGNATGGTEEYKPVQGNSIAKIFDLTVARTGYSEKNLQQSGIPYRKSYIDIPSHAGFYPNAHPLVIKLLFTPDSGKILGAQIVGVDGVDKRIDLIAAAIQFGKTVFDLADLELAYAPPYSSAKDPVNVAGMVAKNMLLHDYPVCFWDEIETFTQQDALFVDVRTPDEHAINAIPASVNIPLEELRTRLDEIPRDRPVVLYCQQGKKGYFAWRILSQRGYRNTRNLSGGFKLYQCATKRHCASDILDDANIAADDNVYTREQDTRMQSMGDQAKNGSVEARVIDLHIDATGMCCPGPILKLSKEIKKMDPGSCILIEASDAAFYNDVQSWCERTGHTLHERSVEESVTTAVIMKGV